MVAWGSPWANHGPRRRLDGRTWAHHPRSLPSHPRQVHIRLRSCPKGCSLAVTSVNVVYEHRYPFGSADQPAAGLTTQASPEHGPEQLPARDFSRRRGFQPVGDDPEFLVFPLQADTRHRPGRATPACLPQKEDTGQVLIVHGPSFCPWAYPFLAMAAQAIAEITPHLPIRRIDRAAGWLRGDRGQRDADPGVRV